MSEQEVKTGKQEKEIVEDGFVVGLEYTLRLEGGEVVDSSDGQGPLQFVQGQGQIVPGLEQALYGMAIGDEKDVVVGPTDGYGKRDPEAMQAIPRDTFPADFPLETGVGLRLRDAHGQTVIAFVSEIRTDDVLLDFNHPLAGETLYFHAKISSLRPATPQDLAPQCGPSCGGCSSTGCGG